MPRANTHSHQVEIIKHVKKNSENGRLPGTHATKQVAFASLNHRTDDRRAGMQTNNLDALDTKQTAKGLTSP